MSASSVTWNYFTTATPTDTHAKCKKCGKFISRGGKTPKDFGTSGLRNHLKQHPELSAEFETVSKDTAKQREDEKQKPGPAKPGKIQQTLEQSIRKPWDIDCEKAKRIHTRIGEMIAGDCQPISIVEDLGFRRLLELLEPRYKIPSRKYFSATVIPEIHRKVVQKIRESLSSAGTMSFTCDIWTSSVNNDAFISLTAHLVAVDFKRINLVLHTRHFPGGHTADRVANSITAMMAEWGDMDCLCFVTDSGCNIVKALSDMGQTRVSCAAHMLQLCVNEAVKSQRVVSDIVALGRTIVGHFSHSSKACDKLSDIQKQLEIPIKKLVQDVQTRWNSTLYMLASLQEQKRALALYSTDAAIDTLSANQWRILEKVVEILQPCEEVSKKLCLSSATLSMVVPLSRGLIKCLQGLPDAGVGTMKSTLMESITTRFGSYLEKAELCAGKATMLDPRFKAAFFTEPEVTEHKLALLNALGRSPDFSPGDDSNTAAAPPPPKSAKTDVMSCLAEIASTSAVSSAMLTSAATELESYLAIPRPHVSTEPLDWWKEHSMQFPRLAAMARRMLSAPATSVASERLFSVAGNIISDARNRLAPSNAEKLIFLHENLHLLSFNYDC